MRTFLKGTAIALLLAGTALATAGAADAAQYNNGNRYHSSPAISIGFGNVAFGFNDGYWDNNHRWHHWRNRREHRDYRSRYGDNYHDWKHNRDSDHGWSRH